MSGRFKLWVALAALVLATGAAIAAPPVVEMAVARVDRLRIMALAEVGQRLVAAGERGRILLSDDAGQTWQTAASPSSASLTAMVFAGDKLGLAVGHNGTVLRSEDGGKTWSASDLAAKDQPALFAVHTDGTKAIAVGAYGAYFQSNDAGKSWQRRSIGPDGFDRHLTGIVAVGGGRFLLAGEAGTLLRSDDDGQNWRVLKSPYEGSYFGMLGLKDGGAIAYGMRGQAYRSDDAGEHWQHVALGAQRSAIQGGRELADGRILLYGNDGLLALKEPGADGFKVEQLGSRRTLSAVLQVGGRFLVGGPTGLRWSEEGARK